MQLDKKKKVYSLSSRDLAVISQAKVGFGEVARVAFTHPGLPPLWSELPYLMLVYDVQGSTKHFWKAYRRVYSTAENERQSLSSQLHS